MDSHAYTPQALHGAHHRNGSRPRYINSRLDHATLEQLTSPDPPQRRGRSADTAPPYISSLTRLSTPLSPIKHPVLSRSHDELIKIRVVIV
ncbi:hypothetical protein E2C01_075878 [Portunus trituberculatus]|uniref:Uncharacterized protein n=1 Tax=Portunus trituberculatus TaxID=210409 RepID=A0A5B7I7A6_PORTR|nr:hypothetical protein [Portunus trituberculatus]